MICITRPDHLYTLTRGCECERTPVVRSPSCCLASAVIKDSPRSVEVDEQMRRTLCSWWGHLCCCLAAPKVYTVFSPSGRKKGCMRLHCRVTSHPLKELIICLLVASVPPRRAYCMKVCPRTLTNVKK